MLVLFFQNVLLFCLSRMSSCSVFPECLWSEAYWTNCLSFSEAYWTNCLSSIRQLFRCRTRWWKGRGAVSTGNSPSSGLELGGVCCLPGMKPGTPLCPGTALEAEAWLSPGILPRNQVQKSSSRNPLFVTPCELASEWIYFYMMMSVMNRYVQRCMMNR